MGSVGILGTFTYLNYMKKLLILSLILFSSFLRSQECHCTEYQFEMFKVPPMDIFEFSNGEKMRVCPASRYNFDGDNENYFKDFHIENCNDEQLFLGKDHTFYKLTFVQDTLIVRELISLPVGKNRKIAIVDKLQLRIYFEGNKVAKSYREIPIRKYNPSEITLTLKEYKKALKKKHKDLQYLFTCLFVAGMSGSEEAKENFIDFPKTFTSIMALKEFEEYESLRAAYHRNIY